ncbi:MAG: zinc-dependent alcohol dehydrogenase family protein [Casimicrobiaceae bacterium]
MRAMLLRTPGTPLELDVRPDIPQPAAGEVLIRVEACGVCRTDLHVVDGELPHPRMPVVPGHEVVGRVVAAGPGVDAPASGTRVGVPWLASTCGRCRYCTTGRENLCDEARFTGYTVDGGYAEYLLARADYCIALPDGRPAAEIAPWLCAGLIGYRALRAAGDARRIGMYGYGSAAQLVAQVARHQGREVYAFTRPGDIEAQALALGLGAAWAGASDVPAPVELDAALIFAPVGALVPKALRDVAKGGSVVCAGIHMSDVPSFPYAILWGERRLVSVANLTRRDGHEFVALAARLPLEARIVRYPLEQANEALAALRDGRLAGTAVLTLETAPGR